jgi:hypothetical protein
MADVPTVRWRHSRVTGDEGTPETRRDEGKITDGTLQWGRRQASAVDPEPALGGGNRMKMGGTRRRAAALVVVMALALVAVPTGRPLGAGVTGPTAAR